MRYNRWMVTRRHTQADFSYILNSNQDIESLVQIQRKREPPTENQAILDVSVGYRTILVTGFLPETLQLHALSKTDDARA